MSVEEQIAAAQQAEDESWESAFDDAVAGEEPDTDAEESEQEQGDEVADIGASETDDTANEADEAESDAELTLEERLRKAEEERDHFRHQFQSNSGRIAAYQRQIQSFEQQAELKTRQAGESKEDAQERVAQEMNDSSWKELQEDFPDIAEALEKRLETRVSQVVQERLGSIDQQLQPIQARIREQEIQAERSALEAEHPDWINVVRSDEYKAWIADKPDPVRQL